jgi:hypothetical protein
MKITLEDIENEKKQDSVPAEEGSTEASRSRDRDLSGEEIARRKRVEGMTKRERLAYYWEYYRIPALVILVIGVIIFAVTRDILNNRPIGFEAELFSAQLYETEEFRDQVAEALGMDLGKEDCQISIDQLFSTDASDTTSMYTMQKILTRLAAGELNVIVGRQEAFEHYARVEAVLVDLRTVLSPEEQAFYESRYVWVQAEDYNGNLLDPLPVGICLDDAPVVNEMAMYPGGGAILGIVGTKEHTDRAVAFLNFLFGR